MAACHAGHPSSYVTVLLGSCCNFSVQSLGEHQPFGNRTGHGRSDLGIQKNNLNFWKHGGTGDGLRKEYRINHISPLWWMWLDASYSSAFLFSLFFWNWISNCLGIVWLSLNLDVCWNELLAQVVRAWSWIRRQTVLSPLSLGQGKILSPRVTHSVPNSDPPLV